MTYIYHYHTLLINFTASKTTYASSIYPPLQALAQLIFSLFPYIKYYNPDIMASYKQVERVAAQRLLDMLPPELVDSYKHLIMEDDAELLPIVKAADKLSAYIKCVEEQKAGNTEFDTALVQISNALRATDLPELQWFMEHCLEAFTLNIDQL